MSHISRRSPHHTAHGVLLHVFAHVDAYQGVGTAEHVFGQLFGQVRLAYSRRPEEHERPDRFVRVFQSHAAALDGAHQLVDGLVLSDDFPFQVDGHVLQLVPFGLTHALYRDACHHGYHFGYLVFIHNDPLAAEFLLPCRFHAVQFLLQVGFLVTVVGGQFKILVLYRLVLQGMYGIDALFLFLHLFRYGRVGDVYARPGFVQRVDGFVREATVGNVTLREPHAGTDSLGRIAHIVVVFVTFLDIIQYLYGFLRSGRFHHDFLETAFQSTVFFDAFPEFVRGRSPDALYLSPCQCGFQHIGRVHAARCRTGTDNRVNLVDEKNHVRILLQFGENAADAFFKLPAILRAGHYGRHVQGYHAFVEQDARYLFLYDAQGQSFHDGRFAHARFTY